jgi:hypothetical protein
MQSIGIQDFDPNQKCQPNIVCSLCKQVISKSALLKRGAGLGFIRIFSKEHKEYYQFHTDLKNLINASEAGCHLCTLLLQTIPKDELKYFVSDARDFGALLLKVWQPKWMSRMDTPVKRWKLGPVQKHCLVALISPVFNNTQFIHKYVGVARTHGRDRNLNFEPKEMPTNSIFGTSSMEGPVLARKLTIKNVRAGSSWIARST